MTLIDHHIGEPDGLGAVEVISDRVGATCTLIANLMQERGVRPAQEEASLLLMGIYEDTGGLSYRETAPGDFRAAAWLVEEGGSLEWVRRWLLRSLEPEQFELLSRLVENTEEVAVNGVPVSFAEIVVDSYHEEAAFVIHRWMETFDLKVGIVMLVRPPHINLIVRSHLPGLYAARLVQPFGGGGHATAASARLSGRLAVEVREELLRLLEQEMPPPLAARDAAVKRIFTVIDSATVAQAKERANQLRVNALPVEDHSSGELVGTVTRQLLDQGLAHGLAGRPVSTVMLPRVPTVGGATPLEDLRDLFLERSYRFVIVEDGGRPVGLITRMELFRRLFELQREAGTSLDNRIRGARLVSQPVNRLLREVAPPWVQDLLATVRELAASRGEDVYLVGGVVRDLLLGRANEDVDLVVEGDGIAFAEALAQETAGRSHPHRPFLTSVITLPSGNKVDVASARTEFYRTPAALPEVETSLIRQDLYRRDFTINALAVLLSGDRFGTLVDFFGGRKDLHRREIRVLNALSFIDDPTRAIRAVRYSRRLGFQIAADTHNLIETAVREKVFERLSGQRLCHELALLLSEPHPTEALSLVAELGLLGVVAPAVTWNDELRFFLLELEGVIKWYEVEHRGDPGPPWLLFLGALTLFGDEKAATGLVSRLKLAGERRSCLVECAQRVASLRAVVDAASSLSTLVRAVEEVPVGAVLLSMAGLDLERRRRLANAVEAATRVRPEVSGHDLLEQGLPPGPHIGRALRETRDALVDGDIGAAESSEFALARARKLMRRRSGQGGQGRTQ
jgi:tRNA nucleotidyltransferase (CCA-adding enzyme)